MNQVRIIIDSSVDTPDWCRDRFWIVPLTIRFGDEELIDGVSIDRRRFYERLVECDTLPTTSQATPAAFQRVFEETAQAGDSAVVITIASKLSGTYQSACIAAAEFENIYVVDSRTAAIGSGILAELALHCADAGQTAEEIVGTLEKKREDVCVLALLDTLEYLKLGGRISKTVALAGGLLNIKPVCTIQDGEILLVGKARGSKQGNNFLIEQVNTYGGIDYSMPVLLGYTGCSTELIDKYIKDSSSLWENKIPVPARIKVGATIGTHIGPGGITVAFFSTK